MIRYSSGLLIGTMLLTPALSFATAVLETSVSIDGQQLPFDPISVQKRSYDEGVVTSSALGQSEELSAGPATPNDLQFYAADAFFFGSSAVEDLSGKPKLSSALSLNLQFHPAPEQEFNWQQMDFTAESLARFTDSVILRSPDPTESSGVLSLSFAVEGEQVLRSTRLPFPRRQPGIVDLLYSSVQLDGYPGTDDPRSIGFSCRVFEVTCPTLIDDVALNSEVFATELQDVLDWYSKPELLPTDLFPGIPHRPWPDQTLLFRTGAGRTRDLQPRMGSVNPLTKLISNAGSFGRRFDPVADIVYIDIECELGVPCEFTVDLHNRLWLYLSNIDTADANSVSITSDFANTVELVGAQLLSLDGLPMEFSAESTLGIDYRNLSSTSAVPSPDTRLLLLLALVPLLAGTAAERFERVTSRPSAVTRTSR